MTACTNHGGKARRVVTAALVGVLSVGTVPMVALATGTGSADGIEVMALDPSVISKSSVNYASGQPDQEFTYNGNAQGLVPSTLDIFNNGGTVKLTLRPEGSPTEGYYYYYVQVTDNGPAVSGVQVKNADGKLVALTGTSVKDSSGAYAMPKNAGTYAVVVGYTDGGSTNASWSLVGVADTFTIVGQSLDDAVLIDGNDVTDTQFNFTGKNGNNLVSELKKSVGVAIDGAKLAASDYDLTFIDKKTGSVQSDSTYLVTGTEYKVRIDGKKAYFGQSVERDFTLGKLNLSNAVITSKTIAMAPNATGLNVSDVISYINDVAAADFIAPENVPGTTDPQYTIEYVSSPSGTEYKNEKGKYTFKIVANKNATFIEGEKEFTVVNAERIASVDFANSGLLNGGTYLVDLNDEKVKGFDLDDIVVKDGTTVLEDGYTVSVLNQDGTEGDIDAPGTHYVKVDVYTKGADGKLVAGSAVAKVVVAYTVVEETDVFVSINGENVTSGDSAYYTGANLLDSMSVTVTAGSKTLVEGTDYDVKVERQQADGKWVAVDEMVDAGTYRITVEGKTFKLASGTGVFTFTVKPAAVSANFVPNGGVATYDNGVPVTNSAFLPYTGQAQVPTFTFLDANGNVVDVPSDSYTVLFTKNGADASTEVKAEGFYDAYFTEKDGCNYDLPAKVTFEVREAKSFADVDYTDWYTGAVYQAKVNQYIKGVSGTEFYMPEADITRADAVVIISRMAGMDDEFGKMDEGEFDRLFGSYLTAFSDVEGTEYYAKAVAWAAKSGVVHGDANADTFRPTDLITREEFAITLANYAKATGKFVASDGSALAALPDASGVSSWAAESVAWAVENGVMGNGGYIKAQDNILRAEVASMAVNYQSVPVNRVSYGQ